MRTAFLLAFAAALPLAGASAQTTTSTTASITLYELPAYLGRSVTITSATTDLATLSFARRAQSARVRGEWEVCPQIAYQGTCRTLNANVPVLSRSAAVSLRPASATQQPGEVTLGAAASIDLESLDADDGTEGQDTAFFARPAFAGVQVSAGSNDRAAADLFCSRAGFGGSAYASRARVQASNLIDLSARVRVRGYALRDVLCRR